MNNAIALILSAALIADTLANIARLWGVRVTIKQQAEMMERGELEAEKRFEAASAIVSDVVKTTISGIIEMQENKDAR